MLPSHLKGQSPTAQQSGPRIVHQSPPLGSTKVEREGFLLQAPHGPASRHECQGFATVCRVWHNAECLPVCQLQRLPAKAHEDGVRGPQLLRLWEEEVYGLVWRHLAAHEGQDEDHADTSDQEAWEEQEPQFEGLRRCDE